MADANSQAKEQQAKGAENKDKMVKEAYAHQGKPTPTQEECDLAKLGMPLEEHEDDGSGPSPQFHLRVERNSEAQKPSGGGYQTRNLEPPKEQRPAGGQPAAGREQSREHQATPKSS